MIYKTLTSSVASTRLEFMRKLLAKDFKGAIITKVPNQHTDLRPDTMVAAVCNTPSIRKMLCRECGHGPTACKSTIYAREKD